MTNTASEPQQPPPPLNSANDGRPPLGNPDSDNRDDVCRICLDDAQDDPELGRLIVPCKCSGTARFVHEACLNSWRNADKTNGFYRCGMCGEAYRLRQTLWTKIAARSYSIPLLSCGVLLALALLLGFAADPFMVATEENKLSIDLISWRDSLYTRFEHLPPPLLHLLSLPTYLQYSHKAPSSSVSIDVPNYLFRDTLLTLGDALRETTSAAGFLLGDCRWASAHEYALRVVPILPGEPGNEEWQAEAVWKRADKSWCGEVWGYEADAQPVSKLVEVVMHMVKGLSLTALGGAVLCYFTFKYFMLLSVLQVLKIRWLDRLPRFTAVNQLSLPLAGLLLFTVLSTVRSWAKNARKDGSLFSFWQLALVFGTIQSALVTYVLIRNAVCRFVRWRIGKVEHLVLDMRDAQPGVKAVGEGKKEQ
ncbi:hypothetical protein JCM6882_004894 [Rhodosporidiobolus microsporus]